jgi:hypothetical protein
MREADFARTHVMRVRDAEVMVETAVSRKVSATDAVAEVPLPDVNGPVAVIVA